MRGIGGIVSANYQQQIQRFLKHHFQSILTILSGPADCIEKTKVCIGILGAVSFLDGGLDAALHFLGFAAHHGGLIGHADCTQMGIWVKSFRITAIEPFQ